MLRAAITLLALAAMPAAAGVLQFTSTMSIGTHLWPNPIPAITIEFTGPSLPRLIQSLAPDGMLSGTNVDVTSYMDGLITATTLNSAGLLVIPPGRPLGSPGDLDINGTTVDDISGQDQIATTVINGTFVEGAGSDFVTPCGTTFQGPFSGGCLAAGVWTLDGAPFPPVDEPSAWSILFAFALVPSILQIAGLVRRAISRSSRSK